MSKKDREQLIERHVATYGRTILPPGIHPKMEEEMALTSWDAYPAEDRILHRGEV